MSADKPKHFLEEIIDEDISRGLDVSKLCFRFPPEPNGYLHIGHAKSICLNFGLGKHYNAPVNLRFDDTNPTTESVEYVEAIKRDIEWLGFKWNNEYYASDYFEQLHQWALHLIDQGKAYVDSQTSEQIADQKGTPTVPGTESPFRNRSVSENMDLFQRMKAGEFEEKSHVLRAKIDMTSPNMLMRDPVMCRVMHASHHRTGDQWCLYPMYDWTHGQSDYIEQISHSFCSLEFKDHRELYDWFLDQLPNEPNLPQRPKQREFARLNLAYTVMSKRKLLQLVNEGIVNGWDDPRMPTLSGMRRRGYPPEAIRNFSDMVGIAKRENLIELALLEYNVREVLNKTALRKMAVMNPVKLVITNYEGGEEWLEAENNPEDHQSGFRNIPFSKELYIEREDFKEEANRKFFRLTLGKEVRLKHAYIIKGEKIIKDASGNIEEIHCTYDPLSKSGSGTPESQRKVKGTLHWVSIKHAVPATINHYDKLFLVETPEEKGKGFLQNVNPNSLNIKQGFVEPSLKEAKIGDSFQFQRLGYFAVDEESTPESLVFNLTVGLKDSLAKESE